MCIYVWIYIYIYIYMYSYVHADMVIYSKQCTRLCFKHDECKQMGAEDGCMRMKNESDEK